MYIQNHILPQSSLGTQRAILSAHFGADRQGAKAYVQAGLHADEAPAYLVAIRLIELLKNADTAGRIVKPIVVVPAANPIGLSQWGTDTVQGRFDNSDNSNFNRGFEDLAEEVSTLIRGKLVNNPDDNIRLIRGVIGDILRSRNPTTESDQLKNLLLTLSHDAAIVLDLHCDFEALLHVYMGRPLWSGNTDLSAQLRAGVTMVSDDSGATPFDEANSKIWWRLAERFPDHPIPAACLAATIELRGVRDTKQSMVEQDANNLFIFLLRRGYITGEVPTLPSLTAEATPLEGVEYISAPAAGIIIFLREVGAYVVKGEAIAEIVNPLLNGTTDSEEISKKEVVRCTTSGVFFSRSVDRFARPGKIIGKVAGKEPLSQKGKYLLTF